MKIIPLFNSNFLFEMIDCILSFHENILLINPKKMNHKHYIICKIMK